MTQTDDVTTLMPFSLPAYNPDVLNTIANLSNDEVFTSPALANQMLDMLEKSWAEGNGGANIWANHTITFLDPVTKSGVFLREIATRLVKGLEDWMPNLQQRVEHILTKQVFGIGITQLTSLLSRRTVYCSKIATGKNSIVKSFDRDWGNIWYERTEHTWAGGTNRVLTMNKNGETVRNATNGRCTYCGASQAEYERSDALESHAYAFIHTADINARMAELFGEKMHFDVVIGNPPYQLNDGGHGVSAAPIYHRFIAQAKLLEPRMLTMVVPARWYSGGKGLDSFRSEMLSDKNLSVLHDFPDSREVFPEVDIAGGVCYFLWEQDADGSTSIYSHKEGHQTYSSRPLLERGADIFIRQNEAIRILQKISAVERGAELDIGSIMLPSDKSFASVVSSRKPFGLPTNFRGRPDPSESCSIEMVRSGGNEWVSPEQVKVGSNLIGKWKVFTSKASHDHAGQPDKDGKRKVLARTEVISPGVVVSESYILLGTYDTEIEARNCLSYAQTRFFRFLVSLRSSTQDITKSRFGFVPTQSFHQMWDDQVLYEKYGLSDDEISFIESVIRPMELGNE